MDAPDTLPSRKRKAFASRGFPRGRGKPRELPLERLPRLVNFDQREAPSRPTIQTAAEGQSDMPDHANDNDPEGGVEQSCKIEKHISDAENERRILSQFSEGMDDEATKH